MSFESVRFVLGLQPLQLGLEQFPLLGPPPFDRRAGSVLASAGACVEVLHAAASALEYGARPWPEVSDELVYLPIVPPM